MFINMKESSFRLFLVILALVLFGCVLFMQEKPEELALESIPLDVYDMIVEDHPTASKMEIVQIFEDEKEFYLRCRK